MPLSIRFTEAKSYVTRKRFITNLNTVCSNSLHLDRECFPRKYIYHILWDSFSLFLAGVNILVNGASEASASTQGFQLLLLALIPLYLGAIS